MKLLERFNESLEHLTKKDPNILRSRMRIVGTVMVVLLVLCAAMFIYSYTVLRNAIQNERMEYVEELSNQISVSQQFMEKQYSETVLNDANILNNNAPTTIEEVRNDFLAQTGGELLLLNERGELIDLQGKGLFTNDRLFSQDTTEKDGVLQYFTSLNNHADYWLFATKINTITLGDERYNHIVLAVPAQDFKSNLSISLFDNLGASYLIKKDGSIVIKPEEANVVLNGYNLYVSMSGAGASDEDVANLKEAIASNESGSVGFNLGRQKWLFTYNTVNETNALVIAVPLSLTAAETYTGMSMTIVFAVLTVVMVALIAIALIIGLSYRDMLRSRQAMAVAAKSDFFSKMSHDIRTPLNAIIGLELLAKDNVHAPEVVTDYLNQSSDAAKYLLSIINDVLDMSRIESGKMDVAQMPFDMNELVAGIKGVAGAMAGQKQQHLRVEVNAPFTRMYLGDAIRLQQIVMNLVSNASKFTPEGGDIYLGFTHNPKDEGGETLSLEVRDSGIGISADYLTRIFTPFEQEQSSLTQQNAGSGLGLSIVHNLVTLMGGTIKVDSLEGRGTTFRLTLPLPYDFSERVEVMEAHAPVNAEDYAGYGVLVAEDNAINQRVITAILTKKFGMTVDMAQNGQEAVDKMTANPGDYALILMDIKMPVMDGLEAAKAIRALPSPQAATIPIVALSANAFSEDVALSKAAGMDEHLSKPIDVGVLWSTLHRVIKK